jgi:hypothetical protein
MLIVRLLHDSLLLCRDAFVVRLRQDSFIPAEMPSFLRLRQDSFISAEMPIVGVRTILYFLAENPCPNLHPHFIICNELLSI